MTAETGIQTTDRTTDRRLRLRRRQRQRRELCRQQQRQNHIKMTIILIASRRLTLIFVSALVHLHVYVCVAHMFASMYTSVCLSFWVCLFFFWHSNVTFLYKIYSYDVYIQIHRNRAKMINVRVVDEIAVHVMSW